MPETSTTVYPKSLDEIPHAFEDWWATYHRTPKPNISFQRPSRSANLLVMRSRPSPALRLRVQPNELWCEIAGRKLRLVLNDFDLITKVDGGFLLFEIKHRQATLRPLKETLAAVEKTDSPLFFARTINGLIDLERALSKERIEEAIAASTDYQVLLNVLTAPAVATQLAAKDPLAAARLRGAERQQKLLRESGGILTAAEVAKTLGISRQAVDKRRAQGQLLGLTQGRRGYAYPAWQFENGKTLSNLATVLNALRKHDPWMQLAFFLNSNDRLSGSSPLTLLRSGELDSVLNAARSYGEHGAA